MRKLFLTLSFLLAVCFSADAVNYRFSHPVAGIGLPHQQVEALAQDGKGNIWIGTRNGLVCYDGYTTRCYYHDAVNANSLAHNFIKTLYVDSRQRLWIAYSTGGGKPL